MNFNLNYSLLLLVLWMPFFGAVHGQSPDPFIQSYVDQASIDSVMTRLQAFEDLGVKEAGSAALDNTRDWITGLYESWGYSDITMDPFTYGGHPVQNIIITKMGTVYPDTYLIVDGHYDTYSGPGVNDNGSGTACILEIARLLKDVETDYSIRFIHFTVEEMGLVGSTHFVAETVIPENMDIRLVFNIDEIGGVAGEVNNTITCERDEWPPNSNNAASAAYTDTLAALTELYSGLNTSISYAYGSDYVPFMNAGYVVTGFYEYNESPYPHSSGDLLMNMDPDYVLEVTKAALASTLYFSGAQETISGSDEKTLRAFDFAVEPNPFHDKLSLLNKHNTPIRFELIDVHGNVLEKWDIESFGSLQLQLNLRPGIYFYKLSVETGVSETGKLINH